MSYTHCCLSRAVSLVIYCFKLLFGLFLVWLISFMLACFPLCVCVCVFASLRVRACQRICRCVRVCVCVFFLCLSVLLPQSPLASNGLLPYLSHWLLPLAPVPNSLLPFPAGVYAPFSSVLLSLMPLRSRHQNNMIYW